MARVDRGAKAEARASEDGMREKAEARTACMMPIDRSDGRWWRERRQTGETERVRVESRDQSVLGVRAACQHMLYLKTRELRRRSEVQQH